VTKARALMAVNEKMKSRLQPGFFNAKRITVTRLNPAIGATAVPTIVLVKDTW
jgi:hypothetical protein